MKKKNIVVISIILVVLALATGYYFFIFTPHQKAVSNFEKAVEMLKGNNKEIEEQVAAATKLTKDKAEPLDASSLEELKTAVSNAKEEIRKVPKMETSTSDIENQAKEIAVPIDYSVTQKNLSEKMANYEKSVIQLKQITNPSSSFVEERLREIDTVTEVQSATENHVPNGHLNKQGGYTASVYFSDNQVTESVEGVDIVDKGTDVGGNIEVYKTKEEAEKRNTYLSAFDGNGILNPGSHYVYGTIVIRTSRHLTANQQTGLTEKIYQKLIEIK
ncbi:EbhA [Streptococcus sanguinis]|uniref:EbhA n=1 Tax=Streptococcus sanguinis TaxID=1305 RepID=A0A0B7GMC4_STRSA|nr:EbhA [Streptococcus sanguinis]CEL90811.1 conserved protein of unknown function [Streptococcus sanguinis]